MHLISCGSTVAPADESNVRIWLCALGLGRWRGCDAVLVANGYFLPSPSSARVKGVIERHDTSWQSSKVIRFRQRLW